jgi:uracil-DNA glycosylase
MKSIHHKESVPSKSQTGRALPAALVSPPRTIAGLRDAAAACKACDLWKKATQTVFGEGPTGARIMLVGEPPGDQEDRSGHPFVGPAGRLLDEALAKAGIDHEAVYVTNVVKHSSGPPLSAENGAFTKSLVIRKFRLAVPGSTPRSG